MLPVGTGRKAYGLRTPQGIEIALFHPMGNLPEPKISHRFCRGAFFRGQLQRAVSANGKKGTKTAKAEVDRLVRPPGFCLGRSYVADQAGAAWIPRHTAGRNWNTHTDRAMFPLRGLVPVSHGGCRRGRFARRVASCHRAGAAFRSRRASLERPGDADGCGADAHASRAPREGFQASKPKAAT